MNTPANTIPDSPLEPQAVAPAVISEAQRLYWSMRRELWENRSIYLAPLAVAAVFIFAFLISSIAGIWEGPLRLDPAQSPAKLAEPYAFVALLLMGATFIVSIFYCLDALQGERRDRSILFWKSLPVSDLTTVLAKASIPIVIIPLLTFAITVTTQTVMLLLSSAVVLAGGQSPAVLWSQVPLSQMSVMLLYHLVTGHALWYAPIYCWLLIVSAWARRAAFLWAALPLLAIGGIEKIAFSTSHFAHMLEYRITGGSEAVGSTPDTLLLGPITHLAPSMFLSDPGLWIGLALATVFLAGAVWLRRCRGPI